MIKEETSEAIDCPRPGEDMKAHHKKRLRKLSEHLKHGKLGHERFNFNHYSLGERVNNHGCGTAGCALGECPELFPRYWSFRPSKSYDAWLPCLKGAQDQEEASVDESAKKFFGLSDDAVLHLFYPANQRPEVFGGRHVLSNATKEQVAANIDAFLEKVG